MIKYTDFAIIFLLLLKQFEPFPIFMLCIKDDQQVDYSSLVNCEAIFGQLQTARCKNYFERGINKT